MGIEIFGGKYLPSEHNKLLVKERVLRDKTNRFISVMFRILNSALRIQGKVRYQCELPSSSFFMPNLGCSFKVEIKLKEMLNLSKR